MVYKYIFTSCRCTVKLQLFWWWYYKQCQRRWIRRKNLISRCKKVIPLDSNKNILLRKSNHVFIRIYHRINKQCVKILVNRTQSKQTVFISTLATNSSYRKNPQQKKNLFLDIFSLYQDMLSTPSVINLQYMYYFLKSDLPSSRALDH